MSGNGVSHVPALPPRGRNGRRARPAAREFPHEVALALRKNGKSWRAVGRELGVAPSTVRGAWPDFKELVERARCACRPAV